MKTTDTHAEQTVEDLVEPGPAPRDWDETPAEAAAWDRRWFGADHDRDEDDE